MTQSLPMPGSQSKIVLWTVVGVVIVIALIVTAFWAIAAGEADSRQQTLNVYEAMARGQRLYDRAVQLLSSPVMTDTQSNQVGPFTKPLNPDSLAETTWDPNKPLGAEAIGTIIPEGRIALLLPDSVNTKALASLTTATQTLSEALAKNPEAEPGATALATRLLARSLSLKGRYHALGALMQRRAASRALDEAQIIVNVLRGQATFLGEYDALLELTDEDVQKRLEAHQAAATEAEAALKTLHEEILAAQQRVVQLRGEIDSLSATARQARADSESSHGVAIAANTAKAQEADAQLHEKLKEVTAIQSRVREAMGQTQLAQAQSDTSSNGAKAAQAVLDHRSKQKEARTAERQKTVELIALSQQELMARIKDTAAAATRARQMEQEALDAYSKASEQLDRSRIGLSAQSPEAAADKGDVEMRTGELLSDRLALSARVSLLQKWVAELWPKLSPPRDPKEDLGLAGYVADTDGVKNNAIRSFAKAVTQYGNAKDWIKEDQKISAWVYQGQLAAAHLGTYNLDPKAETLAVANDIINAVLQDRAASPYLQPVIRQRDMLLKLQSSAAATQPADEPPADASHADEPSLF